jgi:hypothetical protein
MKNWFQAFAFTNGSQLLYRYDSVERFMIDSLETVKRELADERRAAMGMGPPPGSAASSMSGRGTLPNIGKGGKMSGARRTGVGAGAGGAVDIADLAWEDRERVLRLLFSKINSAGQGSYYGGKMPPHSFDVEDPGGGGGGGGAPHQSYGVEGLDGLVSDGMQPGFV